ncbi:hypothetical protein SMSP2_00732 [Limihaloglobus sulfuriphilus]|uniref:Dockerin domain-containing protein n=1 Tax=Limihaloglobus sulfuriphilus TaxID=1851148 RepID=A0A1Q2MCJ1_9BACT|nr:dockerin type I repeat-containing protein [Limihaloglobus sulfuriphilus]AQQ70384.1 hypothetical protein SMSP2_00732 [Limihaloglobus sulfuriphilus]
MKAFAKCALVAVFVLLYINVETSAIISHSETTPPADWSDHPANECMGRWGTNASCVVIGPNVVITTCHQNGYNAAATSPVVINGKSYTVKDVYVPPVGSDIRICSLNNANFTNYAGVYTAEDVETDSEVSKQIVLGGYGKGRGEGLYNKNKLYGYNWAPEGNTNLRWAQNYIDSLMGDSFMMLDFDGPGHSSAAQYEGTAAEYDSGGGWFIYHEGQWKLAGLTYGVSTKSASYSQAWFKNPDTLRDQPDRAYAHRISYYSGWIEETLAIIPPSLVFGGTKGDINGDSLVNSMDLAAIANFWLETECSPENGWCQGRDINNDGSVTVADVAVISQSIAQ